MDEIGLTGVLCALSDPIRLAIVATLEKTGERGWGEFDFPVGKSTLSHHMKVLREAGVILHRKEGTRCWVSLRSDLDSLFPGLLQSVLILAAKDPSVRELMQTT
nr:ArsR family transcriptional regulator [Govania unica]